MEEQEIHLRDYWKIIRKRQGIIFVFFLFTVLIVGIATFTATPLYEATAEVLIEKTDAAQLTGNAVYGRYDPEFNATQIQLIKSFNVAKRIVNTLHLADDFRECFLRKSFIATKKSEFFAFLSDQLHTLLPGSVAQSGSGLANSRLGKLLDSHKLELSEADLIANMIMADISIKPIKASRIVQISYINPDPVIAQIVANEIANAYRDEVLEIKMRNSSYAIKWMSKKSLEEREKLENSERKLQKYMEKSNIITLEDKVAILPEKLRDLSHRLSVAQANKNELAVVYEQIAKTGNDTSDAETFSAITSGKFYQDILGKILDAEKHQQELAKRYGYKHPKMIQAIEQLAALKNEKQNEIRKQISTLHNRLDLARREVIDITKKLDLTKREAQQFNQHYIQYNIMKRDVETNRTMYEALLSQVKEKKVGEEANSVNIWTTKAATAPKYPSKPNKPRNLLLAVILGLFGGIGCAFFLEYLDNTVSSPEELENRTGLSILSIIAQVDKEQLKHFSTNLLEAEDGFSSYAESIKAIRTAVLLSSADSPPKRLLVTSSIPGEGKTTTVVNLAHSFALAQYKVVIIDADLRKPGLHKVFELDNSTGLTPYLAGIENANIIQTIENNLSVITTGPIPPNPSELLVSDRFKNLLQSLEEEFDFILIDSAPIFSATETIFLSRLAKPIIIVKAGETTYDHITESVKILVNAEINPLGVVMNNVNFKHDQYSYSAYKYYGYYTSKS